MQTKVRLCVVMDPLDSLSVKKDSTLAMIWAAQARDWAVFVVQQQDILLKDGIVYAWMRTVKLLDISGTRPNWYQLGKPECVPLEGLDVVLMRKDPPFNMDYIYTTYLLEYVEQKGVLVVNSPQSLRDCNEKVFASQFPDCIPPLLVSARVDAIKDFHENHGDIIVKPLDGMGGESIFRIRSGDKNRNVILDTLTAKGQRQVMAQLFLPEVTSGDKRILVIDGVSVGQALARVPPADDNRANLAVGGQGVVQPLTERDVFIVNRIAPELKKRNLIFVGIDVIGDYVTEINVTCPTGIREIDAKCDLDIGGQLLDCIVARLAA